MIILGNLDCERAWTGASAMPAKIASRIGALATLMRALAPDEVREVAVWTATPLSSARFPVVDGLPSLHLQSGALPTGDVVAWGAYRDESVVRATTGTSWRSRAWSTPTPTIEIARTVNDRRFAQRLARDLGCQLPAATAVTSIDELRMHLERHAITGAWVVKAALTAAGRDRAWGDGAHLDDELATRITRLLQAHRALVFEPWKERLVDVAVAGVVTTDREVITLPPHRCIVDDRGTFRGIDIADVPLLSDEAERLAQVARAVGAALAVAAYHGPFSIDAFAYRDANGDRRFHALCEINARFSFGHVARALAERLGKNTLRVGNDAPPKDALLLVDSEPSDSSRAWMR